MRAIAGVRVIDPETRSLHILQHSLLKDELSFLVRLLLLKRLVLWSNTRSRLPGTHVSQLFQDSATRPGTTQSRARACNYRTEKLTYFQPIVCPHLVQKMSRTVCRPVAIGRSSGSPVRTLTLQSRDVALQKETSRSGITS